MGGVMCLLLGFAALAFFGPPPHPGAAHYQTYCGECHDTGGVFAMIGHRSDGSERIFKTAHIKHHVADPDERAQLIAYLKREMGG
jgi:hypothetical protein